MYRLSEHSLSIETGRHRQTWLPKEERLCSQCQQREEETENTLYYTARSMKLKEKYISIKLQWMMERKGDVPEKLPILLGEEGRRVALRNSPFS